MIYNAENQVLGRFCTIIAKKLLDGEKVIVVNAEKAVISGNPKSNVKAYVKKIDRGDPLHGPYFPKTPDRILRRTVRGMLPVDRSRGRIAYKNLKVVIGVPEEMMKEELKGQIAKDANILKCKYITLGEMSIALGAKKRW